MTARRREETLQDIPVTVTAIGEQQIEQSIIQDLRDVGRLVPNMQIYSAGSGSVVPVFICVAWDQVASAPRLTRLLHSTLTASCCPPHV